MKMFIGEYGRILLYIILGVSAIAILLIGLTTGYRYIYPNLGEEYDMIDTYVGDSPIMIAEAIELEQRDVEENIDYTAYVVAYSDVSRTKELNPVVLGSEDVDLTTKGLYQVFFLVTNDSGQSFMKEVPVLVY